LLLYCFQEKLFTLWASSLLLSNSCRENFSKSFRKPSYYTHSSSSCASNMLLWRRPMCADSCTFAWPKIDACMHASLGCKLPIITIHVAQCMWWWSSLPSMLHPQCSLDMIEYSTYRKSENLEVSLRFNCRVIMPDLHLITHHAWMHFSEYFARIWKQ
jgi:hypothetical protein